MSNSDAILLLVTGGISAGTLDRALYGGWDAEIFASTPHSVVAVIACSASMKDSGFGPTSMSDRLRSFGNVGVRSDFTDADITEAVARLKAQATPAT